VLVLAGCSSFDSALTGPTSTGKHPASPSPSASPPAPVVSPLPSPPASAAGGTTTALHWGTVFGTSTGMLDTQTAPATIKLPGTVAQVGSSNSTQYALLTNGSLYAWGVGTTGQLGDGGIQNSLETPVQVQFPRGVKIAWIPTDAMPYDTGLAVDTTGHVWGWGENGDGELCLGNSAKYLTPVQLPIGTVSALAGASNHLVYDSAGAVWACGQNLDGDLGDGSTASTTTPVQVTGLSGGAVSELVASFANSGALLSDGQYYDWGYNAAGQLGDGQVGPQSTVPVLVSLPNPVRQVALGGSLWNNGQTLVILSTGAVWAWGNNEFCQLGIGTIGVQATPVRLVLPSGVSYQSLATGSGTAYAISTTGTVYAWGVSHVGQLGDGGTQTECTPVVIASHAAQVSSTADDAVISLAAQT
jgi:alpha-tubulin suppressor-like RCC1 family protein